ncbi:MAG: nuclear transport factor 2 family protein [Saprospiraceae bacterium]|nr:nuclear transport factor 2 family protein [Saprospiraceae bacterium]
MTDPISSFYLAFQQLDPESMISQYDSKVVFSDPAFGTLNGDDVKDMWRMLCHRSRDLEITFSNVELTGDRGSARWQARYTFGPTGRKVRNDIVASFHLKEGKIITHHDEFDLRRWARQAMGWKGYLIGGTSFFRKRLHRQTGKLLSNFQKGEH